MFVSALIQDIRFALRSFGKSKLFVAVAVLSLAFGIGANTAIFSLTDQLLVRRLPVQAPEQLVLLSAVGRHYGNNQGPNRISYPMYTDFRDRNQVFSGMFCFREVDLSLNYGGRTERIAGELVSGNYFPVLGVKPAFGRLFTANDDLRQGEHPVAVISYGYWLNRFAGDPAVLGRKLLINGYPFTVIGVSQSGFAGTDPGSAPQIRIPVSMSKQINRYYDLSDRRSRWVTAFGRLKPGMTIAGAKAGLQPLFHQILRREVQEKAFAHASPFMKDQFLKMSMDVLPGGRGRSELRRQFSKPLLVLLVTVALVLLISCANVANLLIARATARQKEVSVRLALGCKRGRIIAQLLVESLLLSLAGGLAGLLLAVGVDAALLRLLPPSSVPLTLSAVPDWRILAYNLLISTLTGVIFGLVPALQTTDPDLARTLKDQAGAVAGGASTSVRKALVVAQIALSLLLLIGAGLFIRTLQNLKDLDPGFRVDNLLAFKVDPTLNNYEAERTRLLYTQMSDALRTISGVQSVGFAVMPVLEGDEWDSWVTVDGYSPKSGEVPDPHMNFTLPGYFETLGIPILVGRDFRLSDTLNAAKVCLVNQTFARKYFGGTNAIGRRIGMGNDPGTKTDITVVGVFRDTRYESVRDEVPPEVIRPIAQLDFPVGVSVYLRTRQDPEAASQAVRAQIHTLDSNLPVYQMTTLERQKEYSLVTERLVASLCGGFALLATGLAAVGLYGVMAFMVQRRTREIGVRMAIGAQGSHVLWLVMREVITLLMIGLGVALPSAYFLMQGVRAQLYGIEPADPWAVTFATFSIGLVALLAGYIPARRATRIDPIRALRYE